MVSVIIPNYNNAKYIEACVESCLQQGEKYLHEIIIVDDFSTDNSIQVIEQLQKKYPQKIKLIQNQYKGGNNARNLGFENASGKYIQWLDSDDIIAAGKFEKQIQVFQENPLTDIVYSDWISAIYQNGIFQKNEEKLSSEYPDYLYELISENWLPCHSYLLKYEIAKKLFDIKAWNPETKVSQDREYFTMAAILGAKFQYVSGFFAIYNRWFGNSISSMTFQTRLEHQQTLEQKLANEIIHSDKIFPKRKHKYLALLNTHALNACYYNNKLTINRSFAPTDIQWKLIHYKKIPIIPAIYVYQHIKYWFTKK